MLTVAGPLCRSSRAVEGGAVLTEEGRTTTRALAPWLDGELGRDIARGSCRRRRTEGAGEAGREGGREAVGTGPLESSRGGVWPLEGAARTRRGSPVLGGPCRADAPHQGTESGGGRERGRERKSERETERQRDREKEVSGRANLS